MFPLSLSSYMVIGFAVLAMAGLGYGKYEHYQFEEYKAEEVKNAREKEHQQQDATDQIRKDKDAQINAINNQLADALVQLRNRPSRTSQVSNNGQVACGNTGSSLSAEDSEFLVREASRADQIRVALEACYAQYDEVTK